MKSLGWIVFAMVSLLMAAVLELNKNTVAGWFLFTVAAAGMILVGRIHMGSWKRWQRGVAILAYLFVCTGIVMATWPPIRQTAAAGSGDVKRTEIVSTAFGDVRGVVLDSGVELFAGIPYAAPPVDELRWKKPRDPEPWSSVLDCDTFAPMSMQSQNLPIYNSLAQIIGYHDYRISLRDSWREAYSEDSLYLNIWKPAGTVEKAPVAVYIHGGSLKTGQPWYQDYSGEAFAEDGVLVVNMGYRLGVFGFLATEEMTGEEGTAGNFGLLDQIKALEWVKENIEQFGGDPDNITLIGESAGAVCVDALCVSPLAAGLFRRAILESSAISSIEPPHSYRLFDEALEAGDILMQKYNCVSLEELRKIPAEKLVGEQETQHHVTIDGYVLPETPYTLRKQGVHNEEAILHGYNAEESGPFIIFSHADLKDYETRVRTLTGKLADEVLALYPASTDEEADRNWAKIYGAFFFNYSHYCLNRLAQENGIPSWEYLFTKDNGRLGCWHSGELVYSFGVIPDGSKLYSEADRQLSERMHGCWTSFISDGDPNSESFSGFEQSADSSMLMEFGDRSGMIQEPDLALYAVFDSMYGWK
ncbi:MAG: carboxylesterase family protein [Oscillospiraceae bacterium]|nr:carboxylesterase family protein [Oscillospiraceae bacterium]